MGFTEHSHKLFQRFLHRPNYPNIWHQLCGLKFVATWMWYTNKCHKDMEKGTFQRPVKVLLRLIMPRLFQLRVTLMYREGLFDICLPDLDEVRFREGQAWELARVRPYRTYRLFYMSMITRLLRMHHVEEELHYDRMIPMLWHIKAFDVMYVIDPATATMDQRIIHVETLRLMFAYMHLRADMRMVDLAEFQQDHPLSTIT